jgi:hypothetical protein
MLAKHDGLQQVGGDGPVYPSEDRAVHLHPCRSLRTVDVEEHMVSQRVLPEGDQEEAAPAPIVVGGLL